MSSAIARNIFRMFSACCCSWLWVLNFDSLVTPSTRWATSGPKRSSTSGEAVLGVLGDVVEERRLDRDRVDAELGEDLGRRDRVGDVRLARRADLRLRGPRRRGRTPRSTGVEVGLRVVRRRAWRGARGGATRGPMPGAFAAVPAAAPSRRGPRARAAPVPAAWRRAAPRDRVRRARPWNRVYRVPFERPARRGRSAEEADREVAVELQVAVRRHEHVGQADRQVLAAAQRGRPPRARAGCRPPRARGCRRRRRRACRRPRCRRRSRAGPGRAASPSGPDARPLLDGVGDRVASATAPSITVVAVDVVPAARDGDLVQRDLAAAEVGDRDVGQAALDAARAERSRIETSRSARSSAPIARSRNVASVARTRTRSAWSADEVGRRVARHGRRSCRRPEAGRGDRGRDHARRDLRAARRRR